MRRPQVSIAGLALAVAVVALGLAAIRSGSPAWSGAMVSIMMFALIVSVLGTILARGPRRVFWLGFATLGWGALLLALIPWLYANLGQYLLAPNLFEVLDPVLHPGEEEERLGLAGFRSMAAMGGFGGGLTSWGDLSPFQRLGIALEVLLWAYLGGWSARALAAGRPASEAERPSRTATEAGPG
jgi:hypothetical protein